MAGGPGSARPWGPLALSNVLTMRLGVELISPLFTPSLPRRAPNPNIGAVPLISHLSAHHHFVCSTQMPQLLHCLASLVPLFERVCHRGWKLSVTSPSFSAPGVQLCSQCAHGQQRSWVEHVLGQLQQVVKSESQKRLRFKTTSHKIYFTIYLGFYSPLICVIIFALSGTTSFATSFQLVANNEIHNESMQMVIFLLSLRASFQLCLKRFTQMSLNASLLSKLTPVTRQLTTMTLSALTLMLQVLKKPRLGPR